VYAYSIQYRRELMRAASPEVRAEVWQTQLDVYRQARPGLDVNTVALIESLRAMLTPEFFDMPTREQREAVVALAGQLAALIGTEDAAFLMHNLGPADGTFASYEPTAMYLTNKLRGLFAARAQSWDCDCLPAWGCYSDGDRCETDVCSQGQSWPYCGWYWSEECNGFCLAGW
jgi:hypothetical protein